MENVFTDVPDFDAQGVDLTQALTSSNANQNLLGVLNVGNNKIKIDGQNARIIVNDGTTDRIIIGYLKDGF